jgi:hypothetical protein
MQTKDPGTRVRCLCLVVKLLVEKEIKEQRQKNALGPIATKGVWRTYLFRDSEELNREYRILLAAWLRDVIDTISTYEIYLQLYLTLNFAGHKYGGSTKNALQKTSSDSRFSTVTICNKRIHG